MERHGGVRSARPLRRHHMRFLYGCIYAALFTGCTASAAQRDVPQISWSGDTVVATAALLRGPSDTTFGSEPLNRPLSIRAWKDLYYVADPGDDEIVLLDRKARTVGRIGTRGRGPGELLGLSHIALDGDRLFAGEAYNGRISEFTLDGVYVRSWPASFAAGALSVNDTSILTSARSADFYVSAIGNEPRPRLRRFSTSSAAAVRWKKMLGHDLIARDKDHVWIFDQANGLLCVFRLNDERPRCSRLPSALFSRLAAYRDVRVTSLEKAIHMRVEAAPLVKDMAYANGRLALLLPLPELAVVIVNVDDGTLTPVVTDGSQLPDWIRTARSLDWDQSGFIVVGEDGVARLEINDSTKQTHVRQTHVRQ